MLLSTSALLASLLHWIYWWGLPCKRVIAPSSETFPLPGYRFTWIFLPGYSRNTTITMIRYSTNLKLRSYFPISWVSRSDIIKNPYSIPQWSDLVRGTQGPGTSDPSYLNFVVLCMLLQVVVLSATTILTHSKLLLCWKQPIYLATFTRSGSRLGIGVNITPSLELSLS